MVDAPSIWQQGHGMTREQIAESRNDDAPPGNFSTACLHFDHLLREGPDGRHVADRGFIVGAFFEYPPGRQDGHHVRDVGRIERFVEIGPVHARLALDCRGIPFGIEVWVDEAASTLYAAGRPQSEMVTADAS